MSKMKPSHREVKFNKEEMEYDIPSELDLSKMLDLGRGEAGIEMARRISRAKGEEKRKLLASLRSTEESSAAETVVALDADVAEVFKDAQSVNKALRAIIDAMPKLEPKKQRKTA